MAAVAQFPAFLAVAVVVIVTPGPDTALTVRNTLLGGRRAGFLTALGAVSGQMVWIVAACAGIAGLLVASEPAFVAVKLVGAAYLVMLGVSSLLHAWRSAPAAGRVAPLGARLSPRTAYRQGVISDLGNPKIALFFTSLLPQFAGGDRPAFLAMLSLGLVFSVLTIAWLVLYVRAVARAGDVLRRPRVRRVLDSVTGSVLVALGLRLAAEHRS
jgi:threonine/homoserine/homoserine lactone efflux protein